MEIAHYRRIAGEKARFVDVSAPDASLPEGLSRAQALGRFHVTTQTRDTLSGARAFIALWGQLPGWRWLARLAQLPGFPLVLETAYRAFLPIRPWLVRLMRRNGRTLP